ncbi:MAG: peptidyl-prolyl cis-trans isomerase [Candidatus Korobacteraceae bacterium]
MRLLTFTVLALSCALAPFAAAQEAGTTSGTPLRRAIKPGQTTELPESAASVKPSDPVITLTGGCKDSTQNGCVKTVSREQFEQMAEAVKPGMTTDARHNFALQYGKVLAYSDQARALGLENTPRFQEILKFVSDQLLVEALNEHYSKEYENQPDQKIEEYYKQNISKYREANLQRVIIPSQPAAAEIKKPTDEEEKAYVDKLRQQWVGGADPVTLQKEAFARMGLNGSVPDINLKDYGPGMIPPNQESVFAMKPGETSQPFTDTGASYIYKMVSEQEKPLSDVKTQIAKTLHDEMMRAKIQELTDSVKPVLNEAYFGPEKKPEAPQTGALNAPRQGAQSSEKPASSQPASPQK